MKKIIILILVFSAFFSCKNDEVKKEVIPADPTLEQLNKLVDSRPGDAKVLYERAKYYSNSEMYKFAIKDMKKALTIDSLNPVYYHALADYYLDDADSRYAINTMEKVVDLYPERIPSLLKLSEFYFIVKNYDKSISTLNSILYLSPDNPEAYFMLGVNFKEMNQLAKAKNSFLTAVENNPEHIDAWIQLGILAEEQNDKTAETYYKNAILVDDNNIEAKHYLAYYYQNNGRLKEAIDTYKKIILSNPSYTPSYLNTGIIYLKQDSLKKAFENFNIMINVDKANPKGYYYRGYTQYMTGNNEAAKKDFEQALKINPDYEQAKDMLKKIKS